MNISTLNGQELRQLLDASRRRGDAALSYKILQEMAARRERPAERVAFKMRRPAEPHLVGVDLGDPVDADDLPPLPNWRPPPREPEAAAVPPPEPAPEPAPPTAPAPRPSRRKTPPAAAAAAAATAADLEAQPPPAPPEATRPLSLHEADPEAPHAEGADAGDQGLRLNPEADPKRPRAPRGGRSRGVAGFALGIGLGIALGWWAARIDRDVLSPPATPAAASIQTAALTPAPTPAPAPLTPTVAEPGPEALPGPPVAQSPQDVPAGTAAAANSQQPARDTDSTATEPPAAPRDAEPVRSAERSPPAAERPAAAAANGCAAAPTPADRQICGDPELRRLQNDLRRAYTEALDAHEDRALLRQRQLAWRDARNTVTDPERLAKLYEERIRKLNAATAAARQQR